MEPKKERILAMFQNEEKEVLWDVHICKADNKCVWCHKELPKGSECFRVKNGLMHIECLKFREGLRPAWWMAERLGISSSQFLRIATQASLKHDNCYTTRFKTFVYLWDPGLVERLKDAPEVVQARVRRDQRKRKEG